MDGNKLCSAKRNEKDNGYGHSFKSVGEKSKGKREDGRNRVIGNDVEKSSIVKGKTQSEPKKYSTNWEAFLASQSEQKQSDKINLAPKGNEFQPKKRCSNLKIKSNRFKTVKRKNTSEKTDVDGTDNTSNAQSKIWFDDVDPDLLEKTLGITLSRHIEKVQKQVKESSPLLAHDKEVSVKKSGGTSNEPTKQVALDCEMVGVGADGQDSILARVSIVNSFGAVLLDKYVKPTEKVTDYRTDVSGIRAADLEKGHEFNVVQTEVANIIKNRVVVGHALHNDFKVLLLSHPKKHIRDTSRYVLLRKVAKTRNPSLKALASLVLGLNIQAGEHSSVEDAHVSMKIYQRYKKEWEQSLKDRKKIPATSNDREKTNVPVKCATDDKTGRQKWMEKRAKRIKRFNEMKARRMKGKKFYKHYKS